MEELPIERTECRIGPVRRGAYVGVPHRVNDACQGGVHCSIDLCCLSQVLQGDPVVWREDKGQVGPTELKLRPDLTESIVLPTLN
jgi:hypothetical protein